MDYIVQVIDTTSALLKIKNDWQNIVATNPELGLFQDFDWVYPWLENFKNNTPHVIVIRDNDKIKAIAPFCIKKVGPIFLKKQVLRFIGQNCSYNQQFITSGTDSTFRNHILDLTKENKSSIIDFKHLSEKSMKILPNGRQTLTYKTPSYLLTLPSDFESYLNILDSDFRKKLKYYDRSINRDYKVDFFYCEQDQLEFYWKYFLELHCKQISPRGKTLFQESEYKNAYFECAKNFAKRGLLKLAVLKLNSDVAGVLLAIEHKTTFYFLNIGYKTDYNKYSLGLLLPLYCIRNSIENKLTHFDFLGGDSAYKTKFKASQIDELNILRFSNPMERTLFALYKKVKK